MLLAVAAGVLTAKPVLADADLVCSHKASIALVRFDPDYEGRGPEYTALPKAVDDGLSDVAAGKRTDCKLPDGRAIRIREGSKQAFAYGMGGADPPAFFSLWIDGRKVLSRKQWKPGYGEEGPPLVAVVIRDSRLSFCTEAHDDLPIQCSSEHFDLVAKPVDRIEYPARGGRALPAGTPFVGGINGNSLLCRRYLTTIRKDFENLVNGGKDQSAYAAGWKPDMTGPTSTPVLVTTTLEPDGPKYRVALFSGGNHYFDGDIAVVAPASTPADRILALDSTIEDAALAPWPPGWSFVSGGQKSVYPDVSDRYVHLNPVSISGRLYFFAYPSRWDQKPAAMLIGFGRDLSPVRICEFGRVEPNF